MSDLFHKAARDGYLDLLREATRRDCNEVDEDGMTPVAWASYQGNLDALRLIVGRGGNTDISDLLGNTPLHHASANGHMNCVTFLVSFGANIWCLDNDFHTALDVAGLHERSEVVKYLDSVVSKQSALNKKVVRKLKEKATLDAHKRVKKYHKLQEKAQRKAEKQDKQFENATIRSKTHSAPASLHNYTHHGDRLSRYSVSLKSNFSEPKPFSAHFTNTTLGPANKKFTLAGVAKKIKQRKDISNAEFSGGEFKVGEVEMDGTRTIRSLSGLKRDHHVLYVKSGKGSEDSGSSRSGDVEDDVFVFREDAVSRALSEPNFNYNAADSGVGSDGSTPPESTGIFERPGFGSVAFMNRRLANGTFMSLPSEEEEPRLGAETEAEADDNLAVPAEKVKHTRTNSGSDSIGTLGSLATRMRDLPWEEDDIETLNDDIYDSSPLELFLVANGLASFIPLFTREKVDLQALMLLSDEDMVQLGLPLGPRRKLLAAVTRRRTTLAKTSTITDSLL